MREQKEKAQRLRALHQGPGILVLPNAWDAASARIVELAGAAAIATTSAGVANALGYPDGEFAPREEVLFVIRRIAHTVHVPVTADVEAGYGLHSIDAVLTTVRGVLDAGAVGLNLEDSDGDPDGELIDASLQADKIRAIREMADQTGIPLVINARIDAFHLRRLSGEQQTELAIERANGYLQAGADCAFVPFVANRATIGKLVAGIAGPLNVLAMPGSPSLSELEAMGVRRLSAGAGPFRATLPLVQRIARAFLAGEGYEPLLTAAMPYAEANAMFERVRS